MSFAELKQFLTATVGDSIYYYYALILMGTSCGFPCNSDLLMVLGGSLAALGFMKLGIVLMITPLAILVGDTITFHFGKRFGDTVLKQRYILKLFPERHQQRVRHFLQQNAKKFIFSIRFVPAVRSLIFLTAGSMKIPSRVFFLMNGLSTILYAPTLVALGFYATNGMQEWVSQGPGRTKWAIFAVVMAMMVYYIKKQRKVQLER